MRFFEPDHALVAVERSLELGRLLGERLDEVLGEHPGKAADIEDQFFGIQCRELTARIGRASAIWALAPRIPA